MREQERKVNSPKVIFEDETLLVVDKPSGFITNDAESTTNQPTVQGWLIAENKSPIARDLELRSGIVHRLDKETSGLLIVAKTREAFGGLQAQFKDRKVTKTYTALAHGKVNPKDGEIIATVGRLPWRRDRFGVLPGGREAATGYKTLANYTKDKDEYSLLELYPKTGRTHQIRIHLKHIGHPIVGDQFYAGRKTARKDRKWCPRLFLHASEITFFHPATGKSVTLKSPLADDLREVLSTLKRLELF